MDASMRDHGHSNDVDVAKLQIEGRGQTSELCFVDGDTDGNKETTELRRLRVSDTASAKITRKGRARGSRSCEG
jgi:hypothetical protein